MRSGVNCTRRNSRSRAADSAFTSRVLATPGTPSSSTWPRTRRAATSPDSTPSWPTMTLATSSRTASMASRGLRSAIGHLLADAFEGLGQGDQFGVADQGPVDERLVQPVAIETGPDRSGVGQFVDRCRRGEAEATGQPSPQPTAHDGGGGVPILRAGEQIPNGHNQFGAGYLY